MVAYKKVCVSIKAGSLDLKSLQKMNKALLLHLLQDKMIWCLFADGNLRAKQAYQFISIPMLLFLGQFSFGKKLFCPLILSWFGDVCMIVYPLI
jgi:hypothetical protein